MAHSRSASRSRAAVLGPVAASLLLVLLPVASANDGLVPSLELPSEDEGEEGCGESGCDFVLPPTSDPLPLGRDVTKAHVGGDCEAGSYATLCETEQCTGTVLVFERCRETSTCLLYARSVCSYGVNQRQVFAWADALLHRIGPAPQLFPTLPSAHQTVPTSVGVGGDCADHDAALSCNYHLTEGDACLRLDAEDPLGDRPCQSAELACHLYVRALEGCQLGHHVALASGLCGLLQNPCDPVCGTLAELSITICRRA